MGNFMGQDCCQLVITFRSIQQSFGYINNATRYGHSVDFAGIHDFTVINNIRPLGVWSDCSGNRLKFRNRFIILD